MEFFVNYKIIPRTISGKIVPEDQRWCSQSKNTKEYIKTSIERLGASISVNEVCLCVGFEGYGSLSWNRNLPAFIRKDYNIDNWPLIWPENLISKGEFTLSLTNINTREVDLFHFRSIDEKISDSLIKIKNFSALSTPKVKKRNGSTKQKRVAGSSMDWRETTKSYPEHAKWIKRGSYAD